jgi:hypothetical protein
MIFNQPSGSQSTFVCPNPMTSVPGAADTSHVNPDALVPTPDEGTEKAALLADKPIVSAKPVIGNLAFSILTCADIDVIEADNEVISPVISLVTVVK